MHLMQVNMFTLLYLVLLLVIVHTQNLNWSWRNTVGCGESITNMEKMENLMNNKSKLWQSVIGNLFNYFVLCKNWYISNPRPMKNHSKLMKIHFDYNDGMADNKSHLVGQKSNGSTPLWEQLHTNLLLTWWQHTRENYTLRKHTCMNFT